MILIYIFKFVYHILTCAIWLSGFTELQCFNYFMKQLMFKVC